jgi:hypothetical protein
MNRLSDENIDLEMVAREQRKPTGYSPLATQKQLIATDNLATTLLAQV